jgi:hypothetical protein
VTSTSTPLRNGLLFTSTYVFPLVAFPLVTYGWWRSSGGSWRFVAIVVGVPVLFGYLMPWVATRVVQRWRFTSGPRLGSYYVHHGFIYGSKLAFALLLVTRSIRSVASAFDVVAVVLVSGAVTAFGGWFHDSQAVRAGKIEIDGGVDALMTFAPASYFAMGATYAAVTLTAYRILAHDANAFAWIFTAALIVLCVVPSLVFLAVDPPTRNVLRGRGARRAAPVSTRASGT